MIFRFIVDECTGPAVAKWLTEQGHDVVSVFDECSGISDMAILERAYIENRIIITNDKDFSDLIFRDKRKHNGVIYMRLVNERTPHKISCLKNILDQHSDKINKHFIVATETSIRIAKP